MQFGARARNHVLKKFRTGYCGGRDGRLWYPLSGQEVTVHLQNTNPPRCAGPRPGLGRLRGPTRRGCPTGSSRVGAPYLRELVILVVEGEGSELGAVPVLLLVRPHPAHLQRHGAAASAQGGSGCLGGITATATAPGPAAPGPSLTSPPLPRQQRLTAGQGRTG